MPDKRTETSQTFANPDGSFTLEQHSIPVRVKRGDEWRAIDTTLERGPDGLVRPRATALDMTFSGGGSSPLIAVRAQGYELRLSWPGPLPVPSLAGNSAVYANVFPDVDLKITASAESYSEVLIVKTPAAARLPEVQSLDLAVDAPGLIVSKVPGGVIEVRDDLGALIFTGPQPIMWDSRGEAEAPTDEDRTETPLEGDKVAQLPVEVSQEALTISPAAALVNDPATKYPLHIDPSLRFAQEGRAMINERYPTTSSWNWEGPEGVGYQSFEPWSRKRLIYKMKLGGTAGTQILKAVFSAYETWAASCTKKEVQVWQTTPIGTGVNWNNGTQAGVWKRKLDSVVDAVGRDECTGGGKWLEFDVRTAVAEEAAASKSFVYLGLRAASETDDMAWKRFRKDVLFVIDYNHIPELANARSTEPIASCATDYRNPSRINQEQPIPHIKVLDPDQQSAYVKFDIWKNGESAPRQTIRSVAKLATSTTDFTPDARIDKLPLNTLVGWKAQATDGVSWSAYSGMCWFIIDTSKPPPPEVVIPSGSGSVVYPVGTRLDVHIKQTSVDQNYFRYTADGDTPTSAILPIENGEASFRYTTTKSGPMVFRAWAYDRSNNQSSSPGVVWINLKTPDAEGIWRMDEGTGSALADSSVNQRAITLGGDASWLPGDRWDETQTNKDWSVRLSPSSSATSSATDVLDTSQSFSVSVRVRLANVLGRQVAMSEGRAGGSGFTLGVLSQDLSDPDSPQAVWAFTIPDANGGEAAIVKSVPEPYIAGTWVYLTGRYNAVDKSLTLTRYDDTGSKSWASEAAAATTDGPGAIRLGTGTVSGVSHAMDGQVDDARIYPGAIDDAAIHKDYYDSPSTN
ncbi:LamG-like jellyroll fold domain-containing protein [Kribbella yunnanensis]|uniref:LamG-like jellyroll fold domain-containing protein n=1 Tax=Kribbella yunnanensis TaxID=190194 RepID=UPI0031D1B69F